MQKKLWFLFLAVPHQAVVVDHQVVDHLQGVQFVSRMEEVEDALLDAVELDLVARTAWIMVVGKDA